MMLFTISPFLRRVLLADATTCVAAGLLMALGADALQETLGLTVALLRYSGLSLFPFAVLLVYLATRESAQRWALWIIIAGNALWVVASILILLAGWVRPTLLGEIFIIAQALAVAVFAELEYFGLRKSLAAATA